MSSGSRIGLHLSAIALYASLAMASSFAQENERGDAPRHGDNTSDAAPKPETTRGDGDASEIDAHVAVPARHPKIVRDKAGSWTIVKPGAPRNLLARQRFVPAVFGPVARNSIGVAVIQRDAMEQHGGAHHVFSAVTHSPAFGLNANSAGKVEPVPIFGRSTTQSANLFARPLAPNRSGINGTAIAHHGSALAGIGGPAKSVTGISGTSIRPKR
jgi:hypothetical protein